MDSKAVREKLSRAFGTLRKQGYAAEENFTCCQSCGCAAINLKGKKGGVFWHAQDDEDLREHGYVCIAFMTKDGKGSEKVGEALVRALLAERLSVKWNWTSAERVMVKA